MADNKRWCPSADGAERHSLVFGVVEGSADSPRVSYLSRSYDLTPELIRSAAPVTPAEVFRIAAPCAEMRCQHFDGSSCRLASKIVSSFSKVAPELRRCPIRAKCRWWDQEGPEACFRCPVIVHKDSAPSAERQRAMEELSAFEQLAAEDWK